MHDSTKGEYICVASHRMGNCCRTIFLQKYSEKRFRRIKRIRNLLKDLFKVSSKTFYGFPVNARHFL
jgi:hypothetical protein